MCVTNLLSLTDKGEVMRLMYKWIYTTKFVEKRERDLSLKL